MSALNAEPFFPFQAFTVRRNTMEKVPLLQIQIDSPQVFRPVYRNRSSSLGRDLPQNVVHIAPQLDPECGLYVIFFEDVLKHFSDAIRITNRDLSVVFVTDVNDDILYPLRINIYVGLILDVIIENPINNITELSLSPQISNPKTPPTSKSRNPFLDPRPIDDTTFDKLLQTLDSTRGIGLTMRKAIDGNALSQADIGSMYNFFHYSYKNAMKWYRKSAKQENSIALYAIGCIFHNGDGLFPENSSVAKEYFARAAEQEHPQAQNMIGHYYEWGIESPLDLKHALRWYVKADKQGCPRAPLNICRLYQEGLLPSNDQPCTIKLLLKAANRGNTNAQKRLGDILRLVKQREMEFNTKAEEWIHLAAQQGNITAMETLGDFYSTFNNSNTNLSIKWQLIAANLGSTLAQNRLALRYFTGSGVPINYQAGIKWYQLAVKSGRDDSIRFLATAYVLGQGVSVNIPMAKELYCKLPPPGYTKNEYSKLKRIEKKKLIH